MACARSHDDPSRLIETTCCKCIKSVEKMKKLQCSPYIESAVSKFEERRSDLVNRQKYLKHKITTMERSIPALIAFNMLKTGGDCDDSPLCKVKQIMKKLSPHPDPTEILLDKLQNTVKNLNGETAELHDKIIAADIKLEESEMELESLELVNEEFEGRLKSLEKELKRHETPSLHSIHSDDLICLAKIRQLGEAEVNLKHSIKELEERSSRFDRQMDRLLKSKEFRNSSCGGITKKIHQLECSERSMHCALHTQKCNLQQLKKKLQKKKELARTNDVKNPSTSSKEKSVILTNPTKESDPETNVSSRPDNVEQENRRDEKNILFRKLPQRGNYYEERDSLTTSVYPTRASIACYDESSCPAKSRSSGGKRICDSAKHRPLASSDDSTLCTKCHGVKPRMPCLDERNPTPCGCSCKGKCATGESDIPCNCEEYLNSVDKEEKRQSGDLKKVNDQSSTDEEYSECCGCSCDDSDQSDTV